LAAWPAAGARREWVSEAFMVPTVVCLLEQCGGGTI
jgi:hypothetical protein